jgi:hypothetical protein
MPKLLLDDNHKYTLDGKPIPGVTSIIGEFVRSGEYFVSTFTGATIAASVMLAAADRGKAIHKAAKLILQKRLAWDALDPSLVAPLRTFEEWFNREKPKVIMSEYSLYSQAFQYAGTPDLVCLIRKVLSIVDFKSSEMAGRMAGPQLSAYEQLVRETDGIRGKIDRYVLTLPEDGRGSFVLLPNKSNDFAFFKSRLYQYRYLRGEKK